MGLGLGAPVDWVGNAFDGMDDRRVGHRHDVYDVAFLVSRHCGFELAVRWFQNDQNERRDRESAWR